MAGYGRLEVFFPDGMHKTFVLTEDNVSVGRQPGNVIPLETDTISRYHLTITHQGDRTIITDLDSANGTFIDGKRLGHDEQLPLIGGEEILIGDLRLFYYNLEETSTRPNTPLVEEHAHVDAERATFQIEMNEPEIAVPPGAHTSAELRVVNRGTTNERYTVEVTGVPKTWLRVDRPEFDLRTGEPVFVQISFKPVREPASAPGLYPVTVTVRSRNDPAQVLQCVITLTVLPYSGFGMALEKHQLNPGQPFRLHLHNQGSADLPITISGRDVSRHLKLTLAPDRALLKPNQRLVVNGSAAPNNNRWFGGPKHYPFDLIVHSGDAAGYVVAQRATVTQRPPLPGWVLYALIGLIVLILVGGGVLLLSNRALTAPEISDFRVQPAEVLVGEPLQAVWSAQNAESLILSVNATPVSTLDGDTISATIPTDGLEGTVLISLQAVNPGGEASAEATAVITPGLTIETFNADADTLIRYVVQPVTFAWSAPGAVTTRMLGTEAISATRIADALPPEGTLTLNAYVISPEQQILVTLFAQDASGSTVQQSLALTVADPLCTPVASTSLYAAPDRTAQVMSTVPAGTPVAVDARNSDGTWLRVRLGGVRSWGEASDFTCADTFRIDDLQPDPTVRQATSTPAASPTASASATPLAQITPTGGVIIAPGAPATPTESSGASG
ncbi:MAG TPA: FHA domain-containing protein [Candidatus Limnocylindrales bacterium]|nr:FHA domain-containing protein [Candidatus Limnocylindrales bacterium]